MTTKKYSYYDWLNGNVVLIFSRREYNSKEVSEPILVSWDNFNDEDKVKIQEKQQSIFNVLVADTIKSVGSEFLQNYQRTKSKIDLLNRLIKRFTEVFRGTMICDHFHCHTSDLFLNYEFWYYQEMKAYIDRHFIGGQLYDYSNVNSPKCNYCNHDTVMPEVMVEAIGSMIKLLKSEKIKLESRNTQSKNPPLENIEGSLDSEGYTKTNPYPDIFSSSEAYDFFCELEMLVVVEAEYVAGYAFIFHNLKDEKLDFPIKKNVRQVDFCDFLKDLRGQKEIYPPKLPKRNPKRKIAIFETCKNKYITSIQSTKKSV